MTKEIDFADGLVVNTTVMLSWRDRFRVLLGRPLTVSTSTLTENLIGETKDEWTHAHVEPVFRRALRAYGEEEARP